MTLYAYKAMDPAGRLVLGRMDALNPADLEMRLKRMDLDFINGGPARQGGPPGGARVARRELINFCFHLEQLARAGVPIVEGMTDLRDSLENPRLREAAAGMIESIEGGKTLSQAMSEYPRIFDGVFTSLVRAGEDAGNLPDVLGNLVESLKWQDELAAHTRKILLYPTFLALVTLCVTLFMMMYLVPQMAGFLKNLGQELPVQTRLLIAVSDFFVNHWTLLLGIPLLAAIAVAMAVRGNPRARRRFDGIKLRAPWIGEILRKIILSRFATVLSMMYASGISILDAIRTTGGVVGNAAIREGLEKAGEMIAEGQNVTTAFKNVGLFPPLVVRMLHVGENTGSLEVALANIGYFYQRDVRESIGRVQVMIEPVMTGVVGLILGWVMLSVLGPIYDVITRLKM